MVSFSESEEAFLFKNLRNVINVWSGGSGQARISFHVNNGKAELQLSYRLGHPEESHLPPQQHHHHPHVQPRRRKSWKRQARDNARAARYQAAQRAAISSSAAATSPIDFCFGIQILLYYFHPFHHCCCGNITSRPGIPGTHHHYSHLVTTILCPLYCRGDPS